MKLVKNLSLVLVLSFLALTITGCETQAQKRETIMKEYATTYFKNHLEGIQSEEDVQTTIVEVNINMLKNINELKGEEQYDLSKLFGCKGESYVHLTINTENQTIENYEFNLQCE